MGEIDIISQILANPNTSISAGIIVYLVWRLERLNGKVEALDAKIKTICAFLGVDKKNGREERE